MSALAEYETFDSDLDLWDKVCLNLKQVLGEGIFKSWITKINYERHENQIVYLSAPTRFIRDWILSNYERKIVICFQKHKPEIGKLDIAVKPTKQNIQPNPNLLINPADSFKISENTNTLEDNIFGYILDKRFTFESFVVGKSNELAYAAAKSIAESDSAQPGSNPLFLYGGVGLGKTHLMQSIAWHMKKNSPSRKVLYISAERFMYQFINALRAKDIMTFKQSFRNIDVLLVDDVQFICGKENTQEEFFHTLNTLIDNKKQIVISCDRSPSDLTDIEERIKSRLGWGLVADVHSTTYELRIGILQSKAAELNIDIPAAVIEFLAHKISSNVRELEGALNKVIAYAKLVGKKITIELTKDTLKDLLRSTQKIVTIEDIQKKVSERYNLKLADLYSSRRIKSIALPRQIAMYLSKSLTSKSLADIGKKFGGKDHTTVIHASKKIQELIDTDQDFAEDVTILRKQIEQ